MKAGTLMHRRRPMHSPLATSPDGQASTIASESGETRFAATNVSPEHLRVYAAGALMVLVRQLLAQAAVDSHDQETSDCVSSAALNRVPFSLFYAWRRLTRRRRCCAPPALPPAIRADGLAARALHVQRVPRRRPRAVGDVVVG